MADKPFDPGDEEFFLPRWLRGEEAEEGAAPPGEERPPAFHDVIIQCRNHPDRPAIAECPRCNIFYCSECLTIRYGRLMCKSCAETEAAEEASDEFVPSQEQPDRLTTILPKQIPDFDPYGGAFGEEGRVSGVLKRFFAFALDLVFARIIYLVIVFLTLVILEFVSGRLDFVSIFVFVGKYPARVLRYSPFYAFAPADFVYFLVLSVFANRTFGMSWLNMRIVTVYGDFVSLSQCLTRTAVMMATAGLGFLYALFNRRRQALHDLIAGTCVINYAGIKRIDPLDTVNVKFD
jgi:uncharacterized RDD family membrane protein YckC